MEKEDIKYPNFITHLGYIKCFNEIMKNIDINCNMNTKNKTCDSKQISRKINLIKLTRKHLFGEYEEIIKNPHYAELCVSWISVKSYYIFYNLLLILEYLITTEEKSFNYNHGKILDIFKNRLYNKEIIFSKSLLNNGFSRNTISDWKIKQSSNIKSKNVDVKERIQQIIKILLKYKKEDLRRDKEITTLNCKKAQNILEKYKVNICEFFYWYRIKANYRDLEFLDQEITTEEFRDYYFNYFELTEKFYNIFKNLINDLSKKRLGKTVF